MKIKQWVVTLLVGLLWSVHTRAQVVNQGVSHLKTGTRLVVNADFMNRKNGVFYNDGQLVFKADFTNNGRYDYFSPSGSTVFKGDQRQYLRGQHASYFSRLSFDNSSSVNPIQLETTFSVSRLVDFNQGIVTISSDLGKLIFEQDAEALNASNMSFVNGEVVKIAPNDFVFPVGDDGFYRPVKSVMASGGAIYNARYFFTLNGYKPTNSKAATIIKVDSQEYWQIYTANHQVKLQLLTLFYNTHTTPAAFIGAAKANRLSVVRWDAQREQWQDLGGTVNLDKHTITAQTMRSGIFTLGITAKTHTPCRFKVFNLVDINGRGENNYMRIKTNPDCVQDFSVVIFNRWGAKVFETTHYGAQGAVFNGYSSGDLNLDNHAALPTGTYFYIINYHHNTGDLQQRYQQVGYVFLKN